MNTREFDLDETLRELRLRSLAENTRKSYRKDLKDIETWLAEHNEPFLLPLSVDLVARYILDRLYADDPDRTPLKYTTLRRRISALSFTHQVACAEPNPCRDERIQTLLRDARRDLAETRQTRVERSHAATRDIVRLLIEACEADLSRPEQPIRLRALRDRALIAAGFGSGGRRRSELARIRLEDLRQTEEGLLLIIPYSKTRRAGEEKVVPVYGTAAHFVNTWIREAGLTSGPLFRGVDRWGRILESLCDKSVALIVKRRARQAGLNPDNYSAHSLRSGFLTEAGRQRIPLRDAMQLSDHRTTSTALRYYQTGELSLNDAAFLLEGPAKEDSKKCLQED